MKRTPLIFGLALAAFISLPVMATPISVTLDMGQVYTGAIPGGTSPWLVATFVGDTDSDTGTLTLTSNLSAGEFLQGGGNAGWAFYLNGLDDIACTAGNCPDTISLTGFNTGPVHETFNLGFFWDTNGVDGTFDGTETATFDLHFAADLTGNPFAPLPEDQLYTSVAHVQGITGAGVTCSGWIVNGMGDRVLFPNDETTSCGGGTVTVPEPAALGVFGMGVLLIGLFLGLRRRYD